MSKVHFGFQYPIFVCDIPYSHAYRTLGIRDSNINYRIFILQLYPGVQIGRNEVGLGMRTDTDLN